MHKPHAACRALLFVIAAVRHTPGTLKDCNLPRNKHILSIFAHPSLPLVRCSVPSWRVRLIQRRRGWPQRRRYAIPVRSAARASIAGGWSWRRAGTRGYCGIGIGWCRTVVIAASAYHLLCHERLARTRDIANGECVGRVAVGVLDHNQVAARICTRPSTDSL